MYDLPIRSLDQAYTNNTCSQLYGPQRGSIRAKIDDHPPNTKPMGYSYFPFELVPTPVSWVATTGNMVHSSRHDSGGHFAAMEKPKELWSDVEEFVKKAWKA